MTPVGSWRPWLVAAPVAAFVVTAVVISGGGGPVVHVPSVVEVGSGTGTSPAVEARPSSPSGLRGTPLAPPARVSPAPPAPLVVVVPTRPVVVVDDNGEPPSDSSAVPSRPSGGGDG